MKIFMFNSNAKKKISITSALFSLLILFFALNCSFCGNFCNAEYSNSEEETTTEIENKEEEDENNFSPKKEETTAEIEHKVEDVDSKEKDEEESKSESTETQGSKRGDLCPFLCTIC